MSDKSEKVNLEENLSSDSQIVTNVDSKCSNEETTEERSEINETDFQSNQNVTEEIIEIPRISFSPTNQKADIKRSTKENEDESEKKQLDSDIQSRINELPETVHHQELSQTKQIPDPIEPLDNGPYQDEPVSDGTEFVEEPNVPCESKAEDVSYDLPAQLSKKTDSHMNGESITIPGHDEHVSNGPEESNVTNESKPDDHFELQDLPVEKIVNLKDDQYDGHITKDINDLDKNKPDDNFELQVPPTGEDIPLHTKAKDDPEVVHLHVEEDVEVVHLHAEGGEDESADGIQSQRHLDEVEGSETLPDEDEVSFCPTGGTRPEQATVQAGIMTSSYCRCQRVKNDEDFDDSLQLNDSFSSAFSYQGEYQDDDPVFFSNSYRQSPSFDNNSGNSIYRLLGESACSTPDPGPTLPASDTDDLEYEYEPGISLSSLEFGRSVDVQASDLATVFARTKCPFCGSDYESDLQLAAELGKTLLERNKSLENSIKQQQAIIDDQAQEIEYLTKQTAVLRDVNDSRLKIYEQLEVSISDLEIANKKLLEENTADKAMIKMLCGNIERLETRCDDLQRSLDESRVQQQSHQLLQRRRRRRSSRSRDDQNKDGDGDETRTKRQQSDARDSEERDSDSPPYGGSSSRHFVESTKSDPFFRHQVSMSSNSSTSTTSSSPVSSSGYSSSSVDSNLQRFSADSDSEPTSISSKTNSAENDGALLNICEEEKTTIHEEEESYEFLRLECIESRERLSEMTRALNSLQSENKRLRTETEQLKENSSNMDSLRSVDAEVQDVTCVRSGKLCRKCLGLVDATPGSLLGSAFGLICDTFQEELKELMSRCLRTRRWSSSRSWLDIWLLGVATLAICIAMTTSMLQAVGLM